MSTSAVTDDNRWALVLGGVATIIFGIAAVFWPSLTLLALLYLFGAYVLVIGVVNIFAGLGAIGRSDSWFLPLILGLFEVGVGVYLLRHPHVAFTTLVILIGFVLIASGIIEFVVAYLSEKAGTKGAALGYLGGLLGVVVGILVLFAKPAAGVAFVWLLGIYAIVVGIFHLASLSSKNR
ncbi:MAG TPA: DUF308 domain-containing protein [Candidatus Sulfotelmatobacter sp.]|nr:DUF308 domain-containing protein [Candidatus Sulfotelmatobacter sp.]